MAGTVGRSGSGTKWQGDLERLNRLPQSPNMNREIHNQPQISLGFIDFVVRPFLEALRLILPGADKMLQILVENRAVRRARGGPAGSATR